MNFHHFKSKLKITERAQGSVGILECRGRIILGRESEEFVEHSRLALSRYDALFINLRDTTDVDARGLGALVEVHRAAALHERTVVFVSPAPQVLRLLCLTNLHKVLSVDLFEEDAWDFLGQPVEYESPRTVRNLDFLCSCCRCL